MLLVTVTDTFVLQMVKQVLRNDTFNIAGWFVKRKSENEKRGHYFWYTLT